MLTNFQNFCTDRLSSKRLEKQYLNIPPHLKCNVTLPCEMFVLKNHNDPKLSETNFHVRLCHLKQLLKKLILS